MVEHCRCILYTSPRGLRASFYIAMGNDTPGPSLRPADLSGYAMAKEARATLNATHRNRRWEEAAMDEAVAAAQRAEEEVQLGFCLHVLKKYQASPVFS